MTYYANLIKIIGTYYSGVELHHVVHTIVFHYFNLLLLSLSLRESANCTA
jgi:hypothetical protein